MFKDILKIRDRAPLNGLCRRQDFADILSQNLAKLRLNSDA